MTADVRIICVEDEPLIRAGIQRILRKAGFSDVITAADNASALDLVGQAPPNLIISDLNRPGGSGEDLMRDLSADPRTRDVPVIILTGDIRTDRELGLWRMGIRSFLKKPIGVADLLAAVNEVLGRATDPELSLVDLGIEGRDLEYKERIDFETPSGRALLAREVLAMANSGGGVLVIGVADAGGGEFQGVGVPSAELERYETTRLNDSLRRFVGSTVVVASKTVRRHQSAFVIIRIKSAGDTLALALVGNENAGLHPGRIYVRTEDARSAELTDPLELRRLVDRLVDVRLQRILRSDRGNA